MKKNINFAQTNLNHMENNNLNIAIKYFQDYAENYNGVVYSSDVISVLEFLKICNEKNLELVGISYKRYDDWKCDVKNLDSGFIVKL